MLERKEQKIAALKLSDNTEITNDNFSDLLRMKIEKLDQETKNLDNELKSHALANLLSRFFHYPVNLYLESEYKTKIIKLAFLMSLNSCTNFESPQSDAEKGLLDNYKALLLIRGNESETEAFLRSAIILEKLPAGLIRKLEDIESEVHERNLSF